MPNRSLLHPTPTLYAILTNCRSVTAGCQEQASILGDLGIGKASVLRYLLTEYDFDYDDTTMTQPSHEHVYGRIFGLR